MDIALDSLDFSAFGTQDLVNLVLQRSEVMGQTPEAHRIVRKWEEGKTRPLRKAVEANGGDYAQRAADIIGAEFAALEGLLHRLPHGRLADIGCGYAIFDLYAYRSLGCDLLLIDIEQSDRRHFGFKDEGAGYSSLQVARRFLIDNGVPEKRIRTWNPNSGDMPESGAIDIAVSFLSCGFHYPVDMYLPFFDLALQPKGAVILDLRRSRAAEITAQLEQLGRVRELSATAHQRRVLLKKRGRA